MELTRSVEKVDWSSEASAKMRRRYGQGPFTVINTTTVHDDCSPGEHVHVTVKLSGRPQGTFCGKFFKPA